MNNEIIFHSKRNNGFFSNLFELIDYLHLYNNDNIEKISVNNFSPKYFDKILNDSCSFYHYFKNNVNNINIINNYNQEWYLNRPLKYNNYDINNIILNNNKLHYINKLITKYLTLNDTILNKIMNKYNSFFF
jgi:hypothetical protein